nr:MAG TPA: hypothetical protein [Caudoviricetes sp.]
MVFAVLYILAVPFYILVDFHFGCHLNRDYAK